MTVRTLIPAALAAPLLLAACAPQDLDFGQRVSAESEAAAEIGAQWTEGRERIEEGRELVERGRERVESGEDMIARGERLIRSGNRLQAEAEADYRQRRPAGASSG